MTPPQPTLEDTLCSRVRLKILKILVGSRALTTTEIAAKLGANYVSTRAPLKTLEDGDVLTHANFGKRIRYYKFKESRRAQAVRDIIEAWRGPRIMPNSSQDISKQWSASFLH